MYHGRPTQTIQNSYLQLSYLTQGGPRLVRLALNGSDQNWFAEVPHKKVAMPHGVYHFLGGHRLWLSPESPDLTYVPDDTGLSLAERPDGVQLRLSANAITGIEKQMTIHLHDDRPALTIDHVLTNRGTTSRECGVWAISMMQSGGTAVLPQPTSALDEAGMLPNRKVVMWPYGSWHDPRLYLDDHFIRVTTDPTRSYFKMGTFNYHGWFGYWWNDTFLCKRFTPQPGLPHPDMDCNIEIYTDNELLELETLGPLTYLAPGTSLSHREEWTFYPHIATEEALDNLLQKLVQPG